MLLAYIPILVASPPFTMGTVFPACILYGPIECPFRLRIEVSTGVIEKQLIQGFKAQTDILALVQSLSIYLKIRFGAIK